MKHLLLIILPVTLGFALTGCYTRVATVESDSYTPPVIVYITVPPPPPGPILLPAPVYPHPRPIAPVYKYRKDNNRNKSHHQKKRDKLRNSGGRNQSGGRR